MATFWRFIQPTGVNSNDGGPWLAKCSVVADSYTVEVTNLVHIWSETLGRREIFRRSLNDETTIDPTEDPSQLRLLIDTIVKPLMGESGQVHLTRHDQDDNRLKIKATVQLPAPLHRIEWTFSLDRRTESAVGKEILIPAWLLAYQDQKKIQDLTKTLIEKDHVIDKLLESIRGANTDLASVFPSTAALKPSKVVNRREQAGSVVPGLGVFDEERWEQEFDQNAYASPHPAIPFTETNLKVFQSVVRPSDNPNISDGDVKPTPRKGSKLNEGPVVPVTRLTAVTGEDSETEDEFEVKEISEKAGKGELNSSPPIQVFSSLPESAQLPQQDSFLVADSQPKIGRIGKIGAVGRRSSPIPQDAQAADASVILNSSQPSVLPARPARRLGAVGWSRQSQQPKTEDRSSPMEIIESSGHLDDSIEGAQLRGGDSSKPTPAVSAKKMDGIQSETIDNRSESETKEALANKRRDELKRALQAQEKVPVKKKKRF